MGITALGLGINMATAVVVGGLVILVTKNGLGLPHPATVITSLGWDLISPSHLMANCSRDGGQTIVLLSIPAVYSVSNR
jgi:hypothetical protein